MDLELYKYQGAGNDFLIADNRDGSVRLSQEQIKFLCDRHYGLGADGLMLLENSEDSDFRMVYYNSDGSGGMMCGNGGRCIVAFAADMGMTSFRFEASDGLHMAEITESSGKAKKVRLKMKNVTEFVHENRNSWFIDTGTRHAIRIIPDMDRHNIYEEGREIRYSKDYAPEGANVNFVEIQSCRIHVRTYEKGVENETFACGTGITASAIASWMEAPEKWPVSQNGKVTIIADALKDRLSVDFIPVMKDGRCQRIEEVWLTGPATYVARMSVSLD